MLSRNLFLVTFIAALLVACGDDPTSPSNDAVYLMEVSVAPDPTGYRDIDVGVMTNGFYIDSVSWKHLLGTSEYRMSRKLITGTGEKVDIFISANVGGNIETKFGAATYELLTDWYAGSDPHSGVGFGKSSELYLRVTGYKLTDEGEFKAVLRRVEHRALNSNTARASISFPADSNFVWSVYPTQVRQVWCENDGTITFVSRHGLITKVTDNSPWYDEPFTNNVRQVKVVCTRYTSEAAASLMLD